MVYGSWYNCAVGAALGSNTVQFGSLHIMHVFSIQVFFPQVDTVKRLCIKKLPRVLVIQLKRFDYDWERSDCLAQSVINPWHACARVTVVVLCVCVCVCVCPFSLFCLLVPLGVQREVSAGTGGKCSKTKKPFSLKLLSSKVRSVINLHIPWLSQPFSSRAMFPCRGGRTWLNFTN